MTTFALGHARSARDQLGAQVAAVILVLSTITCLVGTSPIAAQGTIEPIDLPGEFTRCDVAWGVYNYAYDMMWDYAPVEAEYWYWRNMVDRAERYLEAHCGADIGF